MCTMSDSDSYEKTIIFGGITHSKIGAPKLEDTEKSKSSKTPGSKIKSPVSTGSSPSKHDQDSSNADKATSK